MLVRCHKTRIEIPVRRIEKSDIHGSGSLEESSNNAECCNSLLFRGRTGTPNGLRVFPARPAAFRSLRPSHSARKPEDSSGTRRWAGGSLDTAGNGDFLFRDGRGRTHRRFLIEEHERRSSRPRDFPMRSSTCLTSSNAERRKDGGCGGLAGRQQRGADTCRDFDARLLLGTLGH